MFIREVMLICVRKEKKNQKDHEARTCGLCYKEENGLRRDQIGD